MNKLRKGKFVNIHEKFLTTFMNRQGSISEGGLLEISARHLVSNLFEIKFIL